LHLLFNIDFYAMIKLIATDLDGTLLDDKKQIHPSFWDVHYELIQRGIIIVAASGRQYYTLKEQFKRIENDIIILAENGTMVKYRDKELLLNSLPLDTAYFLIERARDVPDTDVILCGKNSAYVENNNEYFWKDAAQYYSRIRLVEDLCEVEDIVLKVTLWDHKSAEHNSYNHFKEFEGEFKVAVAGDAWLDITHLTANKGTAIQKIQQIYGITPEETLIFGDYLNDVDMMGVGYHSYAMKNAHPTIKKLSRFETIEDNNNNGVVETIKTLFELS
jgi:Cof subfamily protein (haloacid dehalogenase superfamily)